MKKQKVILVAAICALIIIAAEISINILFPKVFQNFEWYGKVLVALFITLVLVISVRSYASVTGTYLTYNFQVNGAIVIFFLVFATSYTREIFFNNADFNFSVQVTNYNNSFISKEAAIYFLDGTYRPTALIDETGIATFLNIQNRYKNKQVKFQLLKNDSYSISDSTAFAIIDNQKTIYLKLENNNFLLGRVINTNYDPVDSAAITITELDTTLYTNSRGRFKIKVPEGIKQEIYNIRIVKVNSKASGEVSLNTSSDFMINK